MSHKALVLNYDPLLSDGTTRLTKSKNWGDPHAMVDEYMQKMNEATMGTISYSVAEWKDVNDFPVKRDGFKYDLNSYDACQKDGSKCHQPDAFDDKAMIDTHQICKGVEDGKYDEIWVFGAGYFGFPESAMAGSKCFYINGSFDYPCSKRMIFFFFNYENNYRVANMLHVFNHRVEYTMDFVFKAWTKSGLTPVRTFRQFGKNGHCGDVHTPSNTTRGYDYENRTAQYGYCDSYWNYPTLNWPRRAISCEDWGCTQMGYQMYWLNHLPRNDGVDTNGYQNNWLKYVFGHNEFTPNGDGICNAKYP